MTGTCRNYMEKRHDKRSIWAMIRTIKTALQLAGQAGKQASRQADISRRNTALSDQPINLAISELGLAVLDDDQIRSDRSLSRLAHRRRRQQPAGSGLAILIGPDAARFVNIGISRSPPIQLIIISTFSLNHPFSSHHLLPSSLHLLKTSSPLPRTLHDGERHGPSRGPTHLGLGWRARTDPHPGPSTPRRVLSYHHRLGNPPRRARTANIHRWRR